jgi:putative transposase
VLLSREGVQMNKKLWRLYIEERL